MRFWTDLVSSFGFALVKNVPTRCEATDELARLVGVKDHRVMFGPDWHEKVEPGSLNDSAYSRAEIMPHTDGTYTQSPPHLQLLHCWQDDPNGGVSGLIDGFSVAEELRKACPEAFNTLATEEVSYHFHDGTYALYTRHPVLRMDSQGELIQVTWNNLDRASLPTSLALRHALQQWDQILHDYKARWEIRFQLQAGDLLLFDNLRLMHARYGVLDAASRRHLYGFYMHSDGLWGSRLLPKKLVQRPDKVSQDEPGEAAPSQCPGDTHGAPSILVEDTSVTGVIDFRSDTLTQPTAEMREAIARAQVGDDSRLECPETRMVEELVANLVGREAGLFVCGGTQGNLLAMAAQGQGGQILCGRESRIFCSEAKGASVLFGLPLEPVNLSELDCVSLDTSMGHVCPPTLIVAENTIGALGGQVVAPAEISRLASLGLPLHLDGARLFNAAVALGVDVAQASGSASTVQLCLSKGLGCPGGSVLVGPASVIQRARDLRKMLGGSSRQGHGLLAAAARLVLQETPKVYAQLKQDHEAMASLVDCLQQLGVTVEAYGGTNIGMFSVPNTPGYQLAMAKIAESGIRLDVDSTYAQSKASTLAWRMVTHRDVSWTMLQKAQRQLSEALSAARP